MPFRPDPCYTWTPVTHEYAEKFGCEFHANKRPWSVKADFALPCATQNEVDTSDAKEMVANGVHSVVEGANMPTTAEALALLQQGGVIFGPAKAANAGGVAVSGLEQSQNALRIAWTHEEVDKKLKDIMAEIHGNIDYVKGANIAGFVKVADAMVAYGAI